jgi:hypothetical protein
MHCVALRCTRAPRDAPPRQALATETNDRDRRILPTSASPNTNPEIRPMRPPASIVTTESAHPGAAHAHNVHANQGRPALPRS